MKKMKKASISWSVKQFKRMFENGKLSFDYPIQRQGGQWDHLQKSLLIHSLADDYPVPPFYSTVVNEMIEEDKTMDIYYILDGKQRLTNTFDYINLLYPLHQDTPNIEIEEEQFEISGKYFNELDEVVQDQILSFMLLNYKMDDVTDEEIEDLFFRLNNGTPLTKQQKAKAKMGTEWAKQIKELIEHPLMKKASFTQLQVQKAEHETAILQTMMLLDEKYTLKSLSSNDVFDYTTTFKEDADNKLAIATTLICVMDYLNDAIETKETILLKKINFPMLLIVANKALLDSVNIFQFYDWMEEFKLSLKEKGDLTTNYKEFSGAGSVKKEKALGRIKEMDAHFNKYFSLQLATK
jgi:hypothetical protein